MDAIRAEYLAASAKEERISAQEIIRQHEYSIERLVRPVYRRSFWGPIWFVGEAPKRSHVAACQSFSRLEELWDGLRLDTPVSFRDLTDRPMPKSPSRWGDMRPGRLQAAIGARKLLREGLGLSGTATGDLHIVLLGSTVREAFGAQRLGLYRWYSLPRCENVRGELFLAAIPHPSPLASRVFDKQRVADLLHVLRYAPVRRPSRARFCRHIERLPLMALDE